MFNQNSKINKLKVQDKENKEKLKFKRIFIEVGTGIAPLPFIGERKFNSDEIYIGIDINKERIKDAKYASEILKEDKGHTANFYFINADAKRLPFKNNIANELYFGNVFGDPSISKEEKINFLKEAIRIMTSDAKLIIKENNTPANLEMLKNDLLANGFIVEKIITPKDKDWNKEMLLYHFPEARIKKFQEIGTCSLDAFVLYARKR